MASARQESNEATDLIATLIAADKIKVWSLLVTVFGDLARDDCLKLPGPFINQLFQRLMIKPEAVRVALHRLRKDGWITSLKIGRVSEYSLTEFGLYETKEAIPYVYGDAPAVNEHCLLCVFPADNELDDIPGIRIADGTYLTPITYTPDSASVLQTSIPVSMLPTWVVENAMPFELTQMAEQLVAILSANPTNALQLSTMDQLAVRVLVLHHWRRIALREPTWQNINLLEHGLARQCHQHVHAVLGALIQRPKQLPCIREPH